MGPTFPELAWRQEQICSVIAEEEEAFSALLDRGTKYLNAVVADAQAAGNNEVSGETAFYLYVPPSVRVSMSMSPSPSMSMSSLAWSHSSLSC